MKKIAFIVLALIAGLAGRGQNGNEISISITIPPPYSPYLSDYSDLLDQGIITLTNLTGVAQNVKVIGYLNGDNGLSASTSPGYQPAVPLVLNPFETKVLLASQQNQDYLDAANMNVTGDNSVIQTIQQTGILPEGNYEICLRAMDYFTNQALSPEAPSGCAFFSIIYAQPPFLINPICADSVTVTNNILPFQWMPVSAPTMMPMLYDLYIVKLMAGQNPNDAMNGAINFGAGNPIVKLNLMTTSTVTLPSDLPLEQSSWYAWCVVAHDPGETVWVENNGRSEVCTFYVRPVMQTPEPGPSTGPSNNPVFELNTDYQMPPVAWISGNLKYRFAGDNPMTISPGTMGGLATSGPIANFNNWYSGNAGGNAGATGTTTEGGTGLGSGLDIGGINPIIFGEIMGDFEMAPPAIAAPPAWVLPSGYNSAGGLPLKATNVVFTARYAVGINPVINSVEDLQIVQPVGGSTVYMVNNGLSALGQSAVQVGSAVTDASGNYSVYLMPTEPFGLIQAGAVNIQVGTGEFAGVYSGLGLYRVVTMEIPDIRYCHPDVVLFPQPGQPLEVPQQVVHVKSYNLNVTVKADSQSGQAAGSDNPIDGAVVRIGRLAQTYNSFPEGYPQGESKMTQFGYSMTEVTGPDVLLCDSMVTNGQGKALLKRLVRSTGACNYGQASNSSASLFADGYYLEAYSHPFIGNYNYHKKKVWNLAPCSDLQQGIINWDNPNERSHGYQPPTYNYELVLMPKDPEIYASVRTDYGSGPVAVPHANLVFVIKKPGVPNVVQIHQTDQNGFLKKQLQLGDYFNGFASKNWSTGAVTSEYMLWAEKSGFAFNYCNGCTGANGSYKKLAMGERWTPESFMTPEGNVKGIVRDEDGNPVEGEVKIGDGVFIPLETLFTYVSSSSGGSTSLPSGPVSGGLPSGITSGGGISFNGPLPGIPPGVTATFGSGASASSSAGAGFSGEFDFNGTLPEINMGGTSGIGSSAGGNVDVDISGGVSSNFSFESIFNCPAQSGNNIAIIVKPYATNLFQDTFYVNIPVNLSGTPTNLGIFTLKKKLHRPVITVMSGAAGLTGIPVQGAQVILSDFSPMQTNAQGKVSYLFPSPANEFRLQVIKDGFAYYDEHVAIPMTKTPYFVTVTLTQGYTVSGIVTNEITGLPIPGAKVACNIGSNAYGDITIETTANSAGQYSLTNVPGGLRYIRASYSDANITYISDGAFGMVPNSEPWNFSLFPAPFHMPNAWNLPVEINSFSNNGSGWTVTGAFHSLPENARFKTEKPNQRLHFNNVPIASTGGTNASGQALAQPTGTQIVASETQFRAVLNDQHVMGISGPPSGSGGLAFYYYPGLPSMSLHPLKIQKNPSNGNGEVKSKAFVMLEAFRMEYQYDGQFYLGETGSSASVSSFKGTADLNMPESYKLMNITAVSQNAVDPVYSVHDFPAHADRNLSYLRGDSLVLRTFLSIDLPQSNPSTLQVDAGKIVILPAEIQIFPGNAPLQFNLETWEVTTNGWTFSEAHGGILTSGTIKTNIFDLNAPTIILRPNELVLPNAQSIGNAGLSISGIAPISFMPGTQLSFGYYNAPQHDPNTGHWRVALFNGNGEVGSIQGLPGWPTAAQLKFQYTENFSDGFLKFTLAPNQYINHYNVINQYVTSLNKNPDGFTLNGPVDLGIPNLSGGSNLNMVYYKEGPNVQVRPNGLLTTFETFGQVHFIGDQQADRITLQNNLLKVPGWMTIYDDESANTVMLRAMLTKTPQEVKLDIMKVDAGGLLAGNNFQSIALGGGTTGKQKILEGTQLVQNGNWQPLGYLAQFDGFTGSMNAGKDKLWFKVNGAIVNDASKPESIELANVPTPFGDFSLTFFFENMEISGALTMQNIPFGSIVINNGSAEMRAGGKGFYMTAALNATYPVIGVLQTNFITGWYPDVTPEANAILQQGMYLKKLPNFMQSGGIHGLYICANKPLIHVDWEVDLLLFAAGLYIDTGVDTRFWVNFSDAAGGAHVGGLAYFDMELYASVLGICEACFGFLAEVGIETGVTWSPQTDFSATVCGTLGVNMSMCGESVNESAKAIGTYSSSNGLDIQVIFGETCGNPMSIGSNGCKHF